MLLMCVICVMRMGGTWIVGIGPARLHLLVAGLSAKIKPQKVPETSCVGYSVWQCYNPRSDYLSLLLFLMGSKKMILVVLMADRWGITQTSSHQHIARPNWETRVRLTVC